MKKFFPCLIIALLLSSCSTSKSLSNDPNGDAFEVKLNKTFEIQFTTNASTGYSWHLTNGQDINIVDSIGTRYESHAPKGMVGASSQRFWKFKAVKEGTQDLIFEYKRFGNNENAIKTRKVQVLVY